MTTLGSCPFCESKDTEMTLYGYWIVSCKGCGVEGPLRGSEAEAIAAWNTRPESRLLKAAGALLRSSGHHVAVEPEYSDYQELSAAVKEARGDG